jgi:hypothetical protein
VDFYPFLRGTSVQKCANMFGCRPRQMRIPTTFKIKGVYWKDSLSRRERVARERRVRAARPTMFANDEIVGRVPLIRRCRATFSPREKEPSIVSSFDSDE